MNILDTFKARFLFEDMTSPELVKALDKPLTVYAGFDPTNDSLQAGNFVTIMALAHLQRAGHTVIALVGGATGLIGDPSGKSKERNLLSSEQVERNLVGRVKIIGTDITEEIISYVSKGVIYGVIDRKGYEVGYKSVEALFESMTDTLQSSYTDISVGVYTQENIADYGK